LATERQAKAVQKEHGGTAPRKKSLYQNSGEVMTTDRELAKAAGMSIDTIAKVKRIASEASEKANEALRAWRLAPNSSRP
jgi:hypothetical protein